MFGQPEPLVRTDSSGKLHHQFTPYYNKACSKSETELFVKCLNSLCISLVETLGMLRVDLRVHLFEI
jgi:hypothetical protein